MLFNQWRAEVARILAGWHRIDISAIPKGRLWRLYAARDVSPWEAAGLCRNFVAPALAPIRHGECGEVLAPQWNEGE